MINTFLVTTGMIKANKKQFLLCIIEIFLFFVSCKKRK